MTPEEMQFLLGLGTIPEEEQTLDDKIKQAQPRPQPQYKTGMGRAFGALGGMVNGLVSNVQTNDLQAQKRQLLERRAKGRAAGMMAASNPDATPQDAMALMASGDPMLVAQGQYIREAPERKLKRQQGEAQLAGTQAATAKTQGEEAWQNAPISPVRFQQAQEAKVPGITPDMTNRHFDQVMKDHIAMRGQDKTAEAARSRVSTNGPGPASDPAVLDTWAKYFNDTGKFPELGMGKGAFAAKQAITKRAIELKAAEGGTTDMAGARMDYGADTTSLKKLQSQADSVISFERAASKNLDVLLNLPKIVDTGSPFFNKPARYFASQVQGDTKMTQFATALHTARTEIAKVLSGSMGSAVLSDSARHEVEGLLGDNATLAQLHAAAKIIKQDMENRKAGFSEQISEIKNRSKSNGKAGGERRNHPDGRILEKSADGKITEVGRWK